MSLNIFQFLKEGTSLKRDNLNNIKKIQQKIQTKIKPKNQDFEHCGKFKEDDSEQEIDEQLDQQIRSKNMRKQQEKRILIRKLNRIKVKGDSIPSLLTNFTKIIQKYQIKLGLVEALAQHGFHTPTPVQMQVIPALIQKRNVLVTAPTGSGKTIAFALPLLNNLNHIKFTIQAIVLVPFYELSEQIYNELLFLSRGSDLKIRSISHLTAKQIEKLQNHKKISVDILVTTPGAFIKYFNENQNLLKKIQYVIMDECDKYFQSSFMEQIKTILGLFANINPVYGLFSATIQYPVEELLKTQILDDAVRVQIGGKNHVLSKISQKLEYCSNQFGKLVQIRNMIHQGKFTPPALIFVQSKERAKELFYELRKIFKETMQAIQKVEYITGDKTKQEREQLLKKFENGETWALIATDLVARGVDFKNVNLVINYDFPTSILTYIHRVGRTGRAEREGESTTFYTDQDKNQLKSLGNLLKISGCEVPEWILDLKKANKDQRKKLQKRPVSRESISLNPNKHVDPKFKKEIGMMEKKFNKKMKERQLQNNGQDQWQVV